MPEETDQEKANVRWRCWIKSSMVPKLEELMESEGRESRDSFINFLISEGLKARYNVRIK